MISYQTSIAEDLKGIALLHTQSWQYHYRGILSDEYLDFQIGEERMAVWTKRFREPKQNQHIITAKEGTTLCGFSCLFDEQHPQYGTYLDNLHVHVNYQRRGIGKKLIQLSREWCRQQNPRQGMYLWVFAANHDAIRFYESVGGQFIETTSLELMDGSGGYADTTRFYWEPLSPVS